MIAAQWLSRRRALRDCTPMGLRLVLVLTSHVNGEGVVRDLTYLRTYLLELLAST
jgi:hypothetical protein